MSETIFTPEEAAGLEDKNVVYEYQIEANNSIKDILLAVKYGVERGGYDPVDIPGYSDMDLLIENLLLYYSITGEKLATFRATTFANDLEKIAWIIRNA